MYYTAKAGVDRLVPRPYSYACAGARMMNFAIIIFAVEVKSVKTVNIMRRENLALYGMRVCMCVCMHVRMSVYACTCACASMFVHACMHVHVCHLTYHGT